MKIPTKSEILEYYPKYLQAHQNPWNRRLHIVGNFATILYAMLVMFATFNVSFWFAPGLLATPAIVYIFAWPAHRLIEKNKPATWYVNPLVTKACDWLMIKDIFTGKIPF